MNPTPIRVSPIDPRHRPEAIAERILPAELRRGRGAATNASGGCAARNPSANERPSPRPWTAPAARVERGYERPRRPKHDLLQKRAAPP